jgi:glycosyltransferase involved in cell wall biosynthesis
MEDQPLVSVVVTTYNHAEYIKECLDSILMQETSFHYEIVIGEDQSSDDTRRICQDYAVKHPDKIKLFLRERKDVIKINGNATGRFNFVESLKVCQGKYIALCEGDDYWSDPLKLKKQVEFLEANEDCVASHTWHSHLVEGKDGWTLKEAPRNNHGFSDETYASVERILKNKLRIKSRTVMFRNVVEELPEKFKEVPYGDISFSIFLGKFGKYGFINESTAVYRIHNKGVSNANKDRDFRLIHDRFNLMESFFFAREVHGDLYDTLLDNFYTTRVAEIAKVNRKSIKAFKAVMKRIEQLTVKYQLNTKTYKKLARKIWLNPSKY